MAGYDARYGNPLDPMSGGRPSPPETSQQDAYEYSKHGSSSGYLGQLPLGADSAQAETASALRTLFGEGADVQALQEPPNQINTLAEGAAVAETGGVLGGDTTRSDNEALAIDPSLSEQAAPAPKDSTETPDDRSRSPSSGNHHHHHPAVKRKATSRAGMLARGGACEFCKRRKLKCSAELPACANCVKSGKECVYAQKKQRSRVKVLEDRLQELEKRLEQGQAGAASASGGDSGAHAASSVYTAPSLGSGGGSELTVEQTLVHNVDPSLLPPSEYDEAFILHDFDSFADMRKQETQLEPDLMTLADAAAADTPAAAAAETNDPWAKMSPEEIVKEIIKVATGGKGEGERIISHLVQTYMNSTVNTWHPLVIPPMDLVSRVSRTTPDPIHPTLLLSLIPALLPLSPIQSLRHPAIPLLLLPHARAHSVQAITQSDPRVLDTIIAGVSRAYSFFNEAKNIDGWVDCVAATSLVRAAGLTKQGGVGERFVPEDRVPAERLAKRRREAGLRALMHKGAIVPPPESWYQFGQRVNLFWTSYICDRAAAIGWGWPSSYNDEDITTPWPKDDYKSVQALLDDTTIHTFLSPLAPAPAPATPDSDLCAQAKSITLLYHAQRLLDSPPELSTPEKTHRLLGLTEGYMESLEKMRGPRMRAGKLSSVWMILYTTIAVLHSKDGFDKCDPDGADQVSITRVVAAADKVLELVSAVQNTGDTHLSSCDVISSVLFLHLARLMIQYTNRLRLRVQDSALVSTLRAKTESFKRALIDQGERLVFAQVAAQMLENYHVGAEWKAGEWERADGGDWRGV
ncbi:conserved hypothetical protein [Cryptococcus deneoformans JEC21]|uniref:Zn(2)-C6 fungal-type domain-containing protein n=1 Tax=Cryptococcus deneoformans (strain JEC21 / ATCC MYA-565) TaxID=214684 RepID=Q5KQ90_CRYD1|nr:conserved hypothetical protein [Cryptococcus neoformans var. neoformans JEC21]AAW41429.1 conserved hypothetical protein [Cryptococcus neoformans var. neoformans JEC21]